MHTIKTLHTVLKEALSAVSEIPALETDILMSFVLAKERVFLHTHSDEVIQPSEEEKILVLLARRLDREPIAYIIGKKDFWEHTFLVTNKVLIPRPETEQLVELTLKLAWDRASRETVGIKGKSPTTILELGTGSGAIAISLALGAPHSQITACDIDDDALAIARLNAQNLYAKNITFEKSDWFSSITENNFDIIVSNPPYIAQKDWSFYKAELKHEPYKALVSGQDGLKAITTIALSAKQYLAKEGLLLIEHGFDQAPAVRELMKVGGFAKTTTFKDLAGLERITVGEL